MHSKFKPYHHLKSHTPKEVCVRMCEKVVWIYSMATLLQFHFKVHVYNCNLSRNIVFEIWLNVRTANTCLYVSEYFSNIIKIDPKSLVWQIAIHACIECYISPFSNWQEGCYTLCYALRMRCNVATVVAKSRTWFYFVQCFILEQKSCETWWLRGMFIHLAIFRVICVVTKLPETSCIV